MTRILAIETSCDETSAAVVVDGRAVLSNVVSSQMDLHAKYGGVVPEIAARAHIEKIGLIVEQALQEAAVTYSDIDAIAVTDGPGLIGSLLIGVTAAKTLALTLDKPLVPVDHIEAHATSAALVCDDDPWPAVSLVVSGGHTSIYHVADYDHIELMGQTYDDAAGETFDKVAAILDLGFPGGPAVDRVAKAGNPKAIRFPRTWLNEPHFNFSYSGLKTAVLYHVYGQGKKYGSAAHLSEQEIADVAASFQDALIEPLVIKTARAAAERGVTTICVGGGVAANSALRAALQSACDERGLRLLLTPMKYCTDNAAMIGLLGHQRFLAGVRADLTLEPRGGLVRTGR
ncbi:MAG: tRNA (adenosine(37)-N6)-threonylcarbamoyltransferase complex transferase subunit TsaD [Phycisphaerales bacterium]|nr:tRNA (adenosine(37)-N6)-threonylcarbamoyltransferase complex transferase subunit TsaD [Phycisphaerales bacterium]